MRNVVTFLKSRQLLAVAAAVAVTLMTYTMTYGTVVDPSDPTLDGAIDLEFTVVDIGDYRQVLGGKFPPPGNAINGDNASGGTFRALDDPGDFFPSAFTNGWAKDDFFSNQQGVAFTLRFQGVALWDNNGIEDGSHATINKVCVGGTNFRDACNVDGDCPGSTCSSASFYEEAFGELVQTSCCTSPRSDNGQVGVGRNHALSLSNSVFDFMYATRVELVSEVTIDEIIGYFAPTPLSAFAFDPDNPLAIYRMNIWSASGNPLLPTFTGDFVGDVLSTDTTPGTFTRSDTGVRRDFHSTTTTIIDDPIFRLTWIPDTPITLPAGVYYFNHDVRVRVFTGNDHFACYQGTPKGTPKFVRRVVTLEDQFETKLTSVNNPKHLCNPASKESGGFIDPTAHLTCYDIKDEPDQPKFVQQTLTLEDQFGELTLTVKKAKRLCVPSEKNGVNSDLNVNHFKCYEAEVAEGTPKFVQQVVTLEDQFGVEDALVEKPKELCLPVDKDGRHGRVDPVAFGLPLTADPDSHLTCYNIERRTLGQDVTTEDQFGELALKTKKAELLCVPSSKDDS